MSRTTTRSRQLSRKEFATIVVRALFATAASGEIGTATVGRIVARIIKYWPQYSKRQTSEVERDWLGVLKAETQVRHIAAERDAIAALKKVKVT